MIVVLDLVLLSCVHMENSNGISSSCLPLPEPYAVIIVGAGISGISAARTLQNSGISNFLILEATSRIGGRMCRAEFAGQTVELGANWIHGGKGASCTSPLKAADKINLQKVLSDYTHVASHVYKQEGGRYEKNEVEAVMRQAEATQEFGSKLSEIIENDMSIHDMQRLNEWVPTSHLERLIDYYYNDFEDGEPPEVTSLKNTLPRRVFTDFGEDQYFITDPRGFESIVHHFAKEFLTHNDEVVTDARLKLDQVVTEICYTSTGVTVKTEAGCRYQGKAVIISVSLGVLQSNLIEFKPEFPEWKKMAISKFSMSNFTKIFLKFPCSFWPTGPGTKFFLYAHERRGYYPIWKHYDNKMTGSNILLVVTSGEEGMRVEQQDDEITKTETMEVLRKIFGDRVPDCEDILVSRWRSNKFYRGAFSNWTVNYSRSCHKQLKAPVGPVYFTGEHTSTHHFGSIEGAYYAGCETAKEVICCLQENPSRG